MDCLAVVGGGRHRVLAASARMGLRESNPHRAALRCSGRGRGLVRTIPLLLAVARPKLEHGYRAWTENAAGYQRHLRLGTASDLCTEHRPDDLFGRRGDEPADDGC